MNIPPQERQKYLQIFQQESHGMGKLSGDKARTLFLQSGLQPQQLAQIWSLCATRTPGFIEMEEFVNAMFLIFSILNGTLKNIPGSLPQQQPYQLQPSPQPSINLGMKPSTQPNINLNIKPPTSNNHFDWHINSSDKANYKSLFTRFALGNPPSITASSISGFLKEKGFTSQALNQSWNLVDVKREQKIGEEAFFLLLHLLNHLNKGKTLPSSLPIHLKNRFLGITPPPSSHSSQSSNFSKPSSFNTNVFSSVQNNQSINNNTGYNSTQNNFNMPNQNNQSSNLNSQSSYSNQFQANFNNVNTTPTPPTFNNMNSTASTTFNNVTNSTPSYAFNNTNNSTGFPVFNNVNNPTSNNFNQSTSVPTPPPVQSIQNNFNNTLTNQKQVTSSNNHKIEDNKQDEEDEILKMKVESLKQEIQQLEKKETEDITTQELTVFLNFLKQVQSIIPIKSTNNNQDNNKLLNEMETLVNNMELHNQKIKRWLNLQNKEKKEMEFKLQQLKFSI